MSDAPARESRRTVLKRLRGRAQRRRERLPQAHDGEGTERRNWRRFWWVAAPVSLALALALIPLAWETALALLGGIVIGALGLAWLNLRRLAVLAEEADALEQENARLLAEVEARDPAIAEVHALNIALDGLAASETRLRTRLAVLGHELRTPLSGLQGVIRLLGATRLDAEQTDYTTALARAAENLRGLTEGLLTAAKRVEAGAGADAEAGAEEVEETPRAIRLGALIGEVIELAAPAAHAKGLDIAGFVAPGLPRDILGREGELRQILHNLVNNAVKYTDEGGVGLLAEPGDSSSGRGLHLVVTDSGFGIPPQERARMFDTFARADAMRDRPGEGLGLGLVARLVQRAGGGIEISDGAVNAAGGRGTRVTVSLPLEAVGDVPAVDEGALLGRALKLVSMRPVTAPMIEAALTARGARLVGRGAEAEIVDLTGWPTDASLGAIGPAEDAARHIALLRPDQRAAIPDLRVNGFDGYLVSPLRPRSLVERLRAVLAASDTEEGAGTALVVEDDPVNALIASRIAEAAGLTPLRAESWAEAEPMLAADHAAVLLDLDLPDKAGVALLDGVRDALEGRAVPLLVVTADRESEAAREAAARGVAVTEKPLTGAALDGVLEAVR